MPLAFEATLPEMVQPVTTVVWPPVPASMAPPSLSAVLLVMVQPVTFYVWLLFSSASMPPPSLSAVLPVMVQPMIVALRACT